MRAGLFLLPAEIKEFEISDDHHGSKPWITVPARKQETGHGHIIIQHAWLVFTFLKKGRDGEREIIEAIRQFYAERGSDA